MAVSEIISSNTVYYPSNFPSIETIVEATEYQCRVVRKLINLREVAPLALKSSAERLEEFKHYMDFVVQITRECTKSTVTIIKKIGKIIAALTVLVGLIVVLLKAIGP